MSVAFVVAPILIGSWPLISAAIIAAGAALGYQAVRSAEGRLSAEGSAMGSDGPGASLVQRSVDLTMEDSKVVGDALMRGESFTIVRGDITATFRVDGRGATQVHVSGTGRSDSELQVIGEELMDKVRQQFAYSQVMAELEQRGFGVVEQEVAADQSIRIRVRR